MFIMIINMTFFYYVIDARTNKAHSHEDCTAVGEKDSWGMNPLRKNK